MRSALSTWIVQFKPIVPKVPVARGAQQELRNLSLRASEPAIILPFHPRVIKLHSLDVSRCCWVAVPSIRVLVDLWVQARDVEQVGCVTRQLTRCVLVGIGIDVEHETAYGGLVVGDVEGYLSEFGCAAGALIV